MYAHKTVLCKKENNQQQPLTLQSDLKSVLR